MATTKLNIGKIPISKGEYQEGTTYQRLNQVTMLGSTYQSKIDDNTSAPAQIGADGAIENINTDKWLCIAVGNISSAKKVVYNNETSGLEAGNVQEAIDETNTKLSDLSKLVDVFTVPSDNRKKTNIKGKFRAGDRIRITCDNIKIESGDDSTIIAVSSIGLANEFVVNNLKEGDSKYIIYEFTNDIETFDVFIGEKVNNTNTFKLYILSFVFSIE